MGCGLLARVWGMLTRVQGMLVTAACDRAVSGRLVVVVLSGGVAVVWCWLQEEADTDCRPWRANTDRRVSRGAVTAALCCGGCMGRGT